MTSSRPGQSERLDNPIEQLYGELLLDLSFDGILVRDSNDRILYWNRGAEEMYGYSRDEAIGRFSHDLLRTEFPMPMGSIFETFRREGRWSGELVHTRKNGSKVTVSSRWSCKFDSHGNISAILETNRDITGYKSALAGLHDAEQLLRFHLDNTPLAVVEWGSDFRISRWSGDAERMFGWTAAEVLGKRMDEFRWVYEPDGEYVQKISEGLQHGTAAKSVSRNRNYRKDGSVIHCEWYNSSNTDAGGNLISIFSLVLDVTERENAAKALRASEERFRNIFEYAPTGIAITDTEGHFLQSNPAYESLTGYSESELRTRTFQELVHPEDRDVNTFLTQQLLRGEIPFFIIENRYLHKSGRPVWVNKHVSVMRNSAGAPDYVLALVMDVTERQLAEERLRASEERFRTLANNIPQLCWMANADGYLTWYNDRWYEYTGTTPEQMQGWGWQSVHDADVLPEVMKRWTAAIERGEYFEMVFPIRGHDGKFRPFLTRITPTKDAQGKVVQWFGTNTDLSRQREAEQAMIRSEKLASAGRMAATIAHEINNPLEAIMNLLFLARNDARCPAGIREYLNTADSELKRVSHITRQVLGFYRDTGAPKVLSVSAVMDEALELFARKIANKQIHLHRQYGLDVQAIAVSGELRQVFSNLIANSIDAVGDHGTIKIRISEFDFGQEKRARITVSDDGIGIAAELLPSIFEPFFTTKGNIGTGLGLWVTKQLVAKQGGTIRVHTSTTPGRSGSSFSITLPAQKQT